MKAGKRKASSLGETQAVNVESYHGQVLEDDSGDDDGVDDTWHAGKLKFRKHIDDSYRSGVKTEDDPYVTVDPRRDSRNDSRRERR